MSWKVPQLFYVVHRRSMMVCYGCSTSIAKGAGEWEQRGGAGGWRLEGKESNPWQRRQNRRRGGGATAGEVSHRLEGVDERRNGNKEE
ncbi:hypothetical protein BHE74_00032373 [Ensete ventricosum]|nr:hypothetical protein BHE74_00032373 [Ensete ventricosum]